MRKIWAIAGVTMRAAVRSRVVLMLLLMLGLVMAGLPLTIQSDGTLEGQVQLLLGYTLGLAVFLLGLTTIWAGCASVAVDIEKCYLQLVVSKPITRFQVWLGKWLGLMIINTALIACCGIVMYGMLHWTTRAGSLTDSDRARLYRDVLVAREKIAPLLPSLDEEAQRIFDERTASGNTATGVSSAEFLKAIRQGLEIQAFTVPSGETKQWQFAWPTTAESEVAATLRFRFTSSHIGPDRVTGKWRVGPQDASAPFQQIATNVAGVISSLTLPAGVAKPGQVVVVEYSNTNPEPVTVVFSPDDGMILLVPRGGFEGNMARALLIVLAHLALLAALSVTAGSLFSMPVAAFVSLFTVSLIASENYLGSLTNQDVVIPWHQAGEQGANSWDALLRLFYRAIHFLVQPLTGADPLGLLAQGQLVSWSWVASALLIKVIVYGGAFALIAKLILNRREIALPSP